MHGGMHLQTRRGQGTHVHAVVHSAPPSGPPAQRVMSSAHRCAARHARCAAHVSRAPAQAIQCSEACTHAHRHAHTYTHKLVHTYTLGPTPCAVQRVISASSPQDPLYVTLRTRRRCELRTNGERLCMWNVLNEVRMGDVLTWCACGRCVRVECVGRGARAARARSSACHAHARPTCTRARRWSLTGARSPARCPSSCSRMATL